jgi:cyanophycinase
MVTLVLTHETRGPLLLIGGAEDKIGAQQILARFVQLAGGANAKIAIIATASAFHELVGQHYVQIFGKLGAAKADLLRLRDRNDARLSEPLELLEQATAVFITGGDQLKLTTVLGGTLIERRLRERCLHGMVMAGTSAGASAASTHMLAYGASGFPPRKAMMQFAPGLGLIGGVVVDQHFGARGRAGRLMTAVAHNPGLIGIGLDEDTAAEIDHTGKLTVLGRGSVMIVDGHGVSYTDIHHIHDQRPITIYDLRLHVLATSYRYDLQARMPLNPSGPLQPFEESGLIGGEGI